MLLVFIINTETSIIYTQNKNNKSYLYLNLKSFFYEQVIYCLLDCEF